MKKPLHLIPLTLALACLLPAARADNCDAIKDGIAGRFRAGGLAGANLVVVDVGSAKGGRVVGTCANSTRQIVLVGIDKPAAPATRDSASAERPVVATAAERAPAASAAPSDGIPTECKDGTIVIGPDCNNPRAVRMTSSDIAKRVQAVGR